MSDGLECQAVLPSLTKAKVQAHTGMMLVSVSFLRMKFLFKKHFLDRGMEPAEIETLSVWEIRYCTVRAWVSWQLACHQRQ